MTAQDCRINNVLKFDFLFSGNINQFYPYLASFYHYLKNNAHSGRIVFFFNCFHIQRIPVFCSQAILIRTERYGNWFIQTQDFSFVFSFTFIVLLTAHNTDNRNCHNNSRFCSIDTSLPGSLRANNLTIFILCRVFTNIPHITVLIYENTFWEVKS